MSDYKIPRLGGIWHTSLMHHLPRFTTPLAMCEALATLRGWNIRLECERGKWRAAFTDATFGYDVHASYEDDAEFADLEDALEWLYERATGAEKEGDV